MRTITLIVLAATAAFAGTRTDSRGKWHTSDHPGGVKVEVLTAPSASEKARVADYPVHRVYSIQQRFNLASGRTIVFGLGTAQDLTRAERTELAGKGYEVVLIEGPAD